MRIHIRSGWGDAVKGGYNGSLVAEHDGQVVGSLEYQTATGEPGFKIAMLKVNPEYQGREIGSHLLRAARCEIPDGQVDPGWMTDQGYLWWQTRGQEIAESYSGQWNADGYDAETREPKPGREAPEPEIEMD